MGLLKIIKQFLVRAFLEKRVDYSHGFSSVFFFKKIFNTPEVTKIVLPQKLYKILRRRQTVPVGPKNWTKKVPCKIQYRTRPKGLPFQFFWHCEIFFQFFS